MKKKWKNLSISLDYKVMQLWARWVFKHCFRLGEDTDRKKIINENYKSYAIEQSVIKSHQLKKRDICEVSSLIDRWNLLFLILVIIAFSLYSKIDRAHVLIDFLFFLLQAKT